jgi:peptidoglycan/xylan/chitin deacetylase (PgdA/CDA1 family)
MTLLSEEGLRTDVTEGEEAIRELTGADPRPWFRCPFGDGRDDPRVIEALAELGYRNVHWHLELEDWEPVRAARRIEDDAVDGALACGDGVVVLMHTWPAQTSKALPGIVERLAAAGALFVGVDELETLP